MSVIYGLHFFNSKPVEQQHLNSMENALNHWQADDKGMWSEQNNGMGHLMLHNTPESLNEKLPFIDHTRGYAITADARIDNRDELTAKLGITKAGGRDMPDSMFILKAYEKFGAACVNHLIGDFAFVIRDARKHIIFCARDQMGVKPLFYYQDKNLFAFASEKKGLLCLEEVDQTISREFFYNKLIWPGEQLIDTTLYEKIKRVPPASTLIVDEASGQISINRYWQLDTVSEIKLGSKQEYDEMLRHHFAEAVKCRTRSVFPVGAELSGGMDSSGIVGAAQHFLKEKGAGLITFTNTLPLDVAKDYPGIAIQHKNLEAVIAFNQIKDAVYITEDLWKSLDEELEFGLYVDDGFEKAKDTGSVALKQAAMHKGVRTLLSGCGGDNMVTTRGRNHLMDLLDRGRYIEYLRSKQRYGSGFNKMAPFIPQSLVQIKQAIFDGLGYYKPNIRASEQLFNIPVEFKRGHQKLMYSRVGYTNLYKSYRTHQAFFLLRNELAQRIESETRMGYYFRLEPRFPMLDIRLLQFFLSIPNELKFEGPMSRMLYRRAVKNWLPESLYHYDTKSEPFKPQLQESIIKKQIGLINVIDNAPLQLFKNRGELLKEIDREVRLNKGAPGKLPPQWLIILSSNAILFKWLLKAKNSVDLFE